MSRRDFRIAVHEPRPPSAWAMVSIASATLWITQQLDPWALAAQAGAILLSLVRRTRPFRWQSNPWMLNAGMLGITAGTIVVALRGEPSTIALAHFAATTQGLQLLDARPRRTEFLLVALALFQVVLAANLTDSVFFTPLLLGFVFAAVWTLVVHTLRSEAAEAGRPHELGRALTPGLLRTTLFASALSVVLALVLFVALPRLRSNVVRGPALGPAHAMSGFSDRVEFGELGRIRQDPRVVMRVETLEGEPPGPADAYWRGIAFDTFDGRVWSVTPPDRLPVPGSPEIGVSLGRGADPSDLVQRIVREPVAAGVLFRVGEPSALQGTLRRVERDVSGGLYASKQADERVRYTVRTRRAQPDDRTLRRDRAAPPDRRAAALLALPPLAPEVADLAARIVAGADSDAARARAIERHLVRHGRYTDTPPVARQGPGDARSPVERFVLGDLAGHCEYFASAMVLLARQAGLPARLVNGFAGGRTNRIGDFVEVAQADAHAWVEIHYERAGWVRYDPTPPDLRARAEPPLSLADRARDLASAIELWWFQRIVGFDRSDQVGALRRAWLAWRGRRKVPAEAALRPERTASAWRDARERREAVVGAVVGGAALCALVFAWRRWRRRAATPHRAYARALHLLERRGLVRDPQETARAFARVAAEELPENAARAFERLTEAYLRERFGGVPAASPLELLRFESAL